MFAGELVVTLRVVIEDVLAGLEVTVLALSAQAFLVHIVLCVTANGRAVGRRLRKLAIGVTLHAFRNSVVQAE